MYVEPCRAVSQHCDHLVIYVVKSTTTAFVLSWSRSSPRGSIMATSCLLGFLPIFNDVYRPYYSTPQLVWYFDFVATTTCLTHWRYCTGCVCQNGSILKWHLWHIYRGLNGMASSYLNKLVSVSSMSGSRHLRSSYTLQLHIPQYSLSTAGRRLFLSQPPFSGTLCQMMCSLQRLFQTDSCFTSHFLTL